jgi:hypothetical protein
MVEVFELPDDDSNVPPQASTAEVAAQTPPPQKPPAKKASIFIGTPAFACRMDIGFVMSLLRLQTECLRRGVQVLFQALGNESLIPRARNILTEQFCRSGCTHLLFLDADISFAPESILRMLEADKDVTALLYPKKYINYERVDEVLKGDTKEPLTQAGLDFNINLFREQHVEGNKTVTTHVQEGTLVRVLDAATGCLLIKRQVIEKMKEHYKKDLHVKNDIIGSDIDQYVALFDGGIDEKTRVYSSEDYLWCRRWQALGGEVWADISQPLVHSGFLIQEGDIRQRLRKAVSYSYEDTE